MNAPEMLLLPDIQSLPDHRAVPIDRVGVRGLRHPVRVAVAGIEMASVATVDLSVALAPEVKGTHMSRFLEVLQAHRPALSAAGLRALLHEMLDRLEAHEGAIALRFPCFVPKRAPVSGVESLMDYDVSLRARGTRESSELALEVEVPVTSLCPCSKEISAYGAHNQRSVIAIAAVLAAPLDPLDLVRVAERAASCELYGLLKRADEKYVTERAYENPRFVEDLVREVALELERDSRVAAYRVASENFESIHNHSAYAVVEGRKGGAADAGTWPVACLLPG